MPAPFVDEFFSKGSLRLSSFRRFSEHSDEARQDTSEGLGFVTHINHEGQGQTLMAVIGQGLDAYVLCGSTRYHQSIGAAFGCYTGFRINDTTAFANVISSHVPGFTTGMEGGCIYADERSILRDMGKIDTDTFKNDPKSDDMDMQKLYNFYSTAAGDDLYFMKPNRYANQNEYRLLWLTRTEMHPYIDIKCPEAREFCERFHFDEETPAVGTSAS